MYYRKAIKLFSILCLFTLGIAACTTQASRAADLTDIIVPPDSSDEDKTASIPFWSITASPSGSQIAPATVTLTVNNPELPGYAPFTNYQWDMDGDGVIDKITDSTNSITWTFREVSPPPSGFPPTEGWTVYVHAIDKNGNKQFTSTKVDIDAPVVLPVIDSFTASATTGETPIEIIYTVAAHAGDTASTISSYMWDFNGDGVIDKTTTTSSATKNYTTAFSGSAKVVVEDSNGVRVSKTIAMAITKGLGAGGEIIAPAEGEVLAGNVSITAQASEATKSVTMKLRAQGATSFQTLGSATQYFDRWVYSWDTSGTAAGTYELQAEFVDSSTPTVSNTVTIRIGTSTDADRYEYIDENGNLNLLQALQQLQTNNVTLGNGTFLQIPSNAFTGEGRLKLTLLDSGDLSRKGGARGRTRVGSGTSGVQLSAEGGSLAFNQPVQIQVPISSAASNVPAVNLALFRQEGDTYTEVEQNPFASGTSSTNPFLLVDSNTNQQFLTAQVDELGTYVVAEAGPTLSITTNKSSYSTGDAMTVKVSVNGEYNVNLYIGLFFPDGETFFTLAGVNTLSAANTVQPIITGFDIQKIDDLTVFEVPALPALTEGTYKWRIVAIGTTAETSSFIGDQSVEWTFSTTASTPTTPFGLPQK